MNCSKHPDRVAVAQCSECGAGICRECTEKTRYLKDEFGVLCVDCYGNKISEMCNYLRHERGKLLKRIIISCICYFLGMIMILSFFFGKSAQNGILFIFIGVLLCGFYTGLTWKKAAEEAHDEYEYKHGVTYVITDTGIEREDGFWSKVIFFLIGIVLGVVITPIRVVVDCVNRAKLKKSVQYFQTELSSL